MDSLQEIICEKRTYTRLYHSHKHGYSQFLFPLEGSIDLETDGRQVKLKPDHFYIFRRSASIVSVQSAEMNVLYWMFRFMQ